MEFRRTSSLSIREDGALERTTAACSILLLTEALKKLISDWMLRPDFLYAKGLRKFSKRVHFVKALLI
jgi:hypothetical protein